MAATYSAGGTCCRHAGVRGTRLASKILTALDGLRAEGGTALGDAIGLSLDMAQGAIEPGAVPGRSPSASPEPSADPSPAPSAATYPDEQPLVATVLLSDGANSTGRLEPDEAARAAAAAGMPVYTIALGTASGVVSVPDEFGVPQVVPVPPDTDTLAAIAETTGARSFEAPSADDLRQIYESLGSRVGTRQESQEITQWFAAAGLVLMVAGAGLAAHWFNRFP